MKNMLILEKCKMSASKSLSVVRVPIELYMFKWAIMTLNNLPSISSCQVYSRKMRKMSFRTLALLATSGSFGTLFMLLLTGLEISGLLTTMLRVCKSDKAKCPVVALCGRRKYMHSAL